MSTATTTSPGTDTTRPWWRRVFGKHPIGYLFAAPYVIFWVALFAWPLYLAVYMSFRDWFFAAPGADVDRPFIGLANHADVLADPAVHRAALNVAIFILINVPLTVVVAMVLAAALNQALPLRGFFRTAYYVPYVTASVAMIAVWLFLFPFWYMVVGSLQTQPDTTVAGAFPSPGNLTFANYADIDARVDLLQTLLNSSIFTGGVIVLTLVLGLLAGYALAVLDFRGRGAVFTIVLLSLVLPFQLLMIPLYVLLVRTYGLADTYLGMILPFAVNATAVFIFRQFFRSLPDEMFEAARIDGASELQILVRIAVPMAKPAILTAVLVTFIGPWNEFLWPFLITKDQAMQPLAVALANYITTIAGRAANPFGAILAGATVLALPAVALFLAFQRHFLSTDIGSGFKG